MFIRSPGTALQRVAPDEHEHCVSDGEQTVRTACSAWFWITSNFPICPSWEAVFWYSRCEKCRSMRPLLWGSRDMLLGQFASSKTVQKSRFHYTTERNTQCSCCVRCVNCIKPQCYAVTSAPNTEKLRLLKRNHRLTVLTCRVPRDYLCMTSGFPSPSRSLSIRGLVPKDRGEKKRRKFCLSF